MDEHRRRTAEAFDAIQRGKQYVYRRTFTDGDVAMFCGVTGDFNPYHQDDVFAAASPFGRRIVPGLGSPRSKEGMHLGDHGYIRWLAPRISGIED